MFSCVVVSLLMSCVCMWRGGEGRSGRRGEEWEGEEQAWEEVSQTACCVYKHDCTCTWYRISIFEMLKNIFLDGEINIAGYRLMQQYWK